TGGPPLLASRRARRSLGRAGLLRRRAGPSTWRGRPARCRGAQPRCRSRSVSRLLVVLFVVLVGGGGGLGGLPPVEPLQVGGQSGFHFRPHFVQSLCVHLPLSASGRVATGRLALALRIWSSRFCVSLIS